MKRLFAAFFAIMLIPACLFGCAPSYFVKSDAVFAGIVLDVKLTAAIPKKHTKKWFRSQPRSTAR